MTYPKILLLLGSMASAAFSLLADSQLEEEISDFFHDSEIADFRIAPGGTNVSFAEYYGRSRRSLITIDFEKGQKRGLEPMAGEDIYSNGWIGPDRLVYTKVKMGSTTYSGVFTCKSLIEDIEKLDTIEKLPRLVHTVPSEPNLCAVTDVRQPGKAKDIYYLNVDRGQYVRTVKNPGTIDRFYFDVTGEVRIGGSKGEESGSRSWLLYDAENKSWEEIKVSREVADWRFFDGGNVAYAELTDGPRVELQLFDFEKSEFVGEPIGSDLVDVTVDGFIHDPTTGAIFGIRINEPRPHIRWFDPGIEALASQLENSFAGAMVTFLGVNSVNNDIFFRVQSDTNPSSLFSISQAGKVTPLGHANSKIFKYELPNTNPISFQNRNGDTIHGFLTMPLESEGEKVPLIVNVHGGPHSHDRWTYDPERQFFAYKGYAVLNINYRGSSGFGKSFWEQDGFESILRRSINDVIDGTRWAIENASIDANRVAITGGSYGGFAAIEAVAREPDLYRCAVGFAGVYDWERQLKASRSESRSNWDWFLGEKYGDLKEMKPVYDALSPVTYAEKIKVPVLLIHGKADFRVEENQSKSMHKAILKAGGKSKLSLDTWGRHGFVDEERRVDFFREVYAFLEKNMK